MHPHKRWALMQQRKRELTRRQGIIFLASLPLALAVVIAIFESESEVSVLDLAIPGLTSLGWIQAWALVLLACAVLVAIVARMFWRCPACERFLGGRVVWQHCPHCGARFDDISRPRYL